MKQITLLALTAFIMMCTGNSDRENIRVIAHRGASAEAPENTLAAFQKAHDSGAEWFELDVYLSKDLVPVVIHDGTVDRTTNGMGKVTDKTVEELQSLDAGSWFNPAFAGEKIPTLEETFSFAKDKIKIYVEIKGAHPVLPEKIVELIEKHRMKDEVVVQSFSLTQLERMRGLSDDITLEFLTGDYKEIDLQKAASIGAVSINPGYTKLRKEDIEQIHRLGLRVVPYTINDPEEIRRLIAMGVDGIITDKPETALRIITEE